MIKYTFCLITDKEEEEEMGKKGIFMSVLIVSSKSRRQTVLHIGGNLALKIPPANVL